jgi:hypothetical protein
VDVLDFAELILPLIVPSGQTTIPAAAPAPPSEPEGGPEKESHLGSLANGAGESSIPRFRAALDKYEEAVAERTRFAVLASRQACLNAHTWGEITESSPLVQRRVVRLDLELLHANGLMQT